MFRVSIATDESLLCPAFPVVDRGRAEERRVEFLFCLQGVLCWCCVSCGGSCCFPGEDAERAVGTARVYVLLFGRAAPIRER